MDRRTALPIYPDPRREYSFEWASNLVRALDQLNTLLKNPGEGRNTKIVLTEVPTSDYGLEAGTVFSVNGQLFVSMLNRPFVDGLSATGQVGTVTVTV